MGSLVTEIFTGFSDVIKGLIGGMKTAFAEFLYVDPAATEKVIGDLPKFLFLMFGCGLATGIVYTIVRLVKRHK